MCFKGWHNLDADVRLMLGSSDVIPSLVRYLLGPTSPLFTVLLFTSVPALLAVNIEGISLSSSSHQCRYREMILRHALHKPIVANSHGVYFSCVAV